MSAQELADAIEQLLGFDTTYDQIDEVNGGGLEASVEVIDKNGQKFLVRVEEDGHR